jgi:hypothetical protein
MPGRECLICSMEEADPASRVFLDELWAAEVAPGYEVPGWFFLRSRRHAEKLTGLDDAETATFGRHAHDLIRCHRSCAGARRCSCWPRAAMRRPRRPWPETSGSPMRKLSVAANTPPWADR